MSATQPRETRVLELDCSNKDGQLFKLKTGRLCHEYLIIRYFIQREFTNTGNQVAMYVHCASHFPGDGLGCSGCVCASHGRTYTITEGRLSPDDLLWFATVLGQKCHLGF